MKYLPWPEPPIPANATATGTYRMSNGTYVLYYPSGQLRFLCRVISGQVKSWFNLAEDGKSGHWDQGNTGEAYYADGRMETFSPWDDTVPFAAPLPFEEWIAKVKGDLHQPVPPEAPEVLELDLKDLRASCRLNFQGRPEDSDTDALRLRLLALVRRLLAAIPDFANTPGRLRKALQESAQMSPEWVDLLLEQLPLCERNYSFFWRPCWTGLFEWKKEEAGWLMRTVAGFVPPLDGLRLFHSLVPIPMSASTPLAEACPLRLLIFACDLWARWREGGEPLRLAKALQPGAKFSAELAPWDRHPQELIAWTEKWSQAEPDPRLLEVWPQMEGAVDYWRGKRSTFPHWSSR